MGNNYDVFLKAKKEMEETKNLNEIDREIKISNKIEEKIEKYSEESEQENKVRKEKEALDDLYNDKKRNEDGKLPPWWQH